MMMYLRNHEPKKYLNINNDDVLKVIDLRVEIEVFEGRFLSTISKGDF